MPRLKLFAKPSTLRVVIDTNLFVRGLMEATATRALLEAWRAERFTLVTSEALLTEIVTVLTRPKFRRYFSLTEVAELVELVVEHSEIIEPDEHLHLCRDPKDNIFLDVAVAARANYIVTGDDDLKGDIHLKEHMRRKYRVHIVSMPEFMATLERPRGCFPFGR